MELSEDQIRSLWKRAIAKAELMVKDLHEAANFLAGKTKEFKGLALKDGVAEQQSNGYVKGYQDGYIDALKNIKIDL